MISAVALPQLATRVRAGMALPANWWQAARFLVVGASGFAINLAVFFGLVHGLGVDYRIAAVCSNTIALVSNFFCNRAWTFKATTVEARVQAPRFALVSLTGFVVNLLVLQLAVELVELPSLAAEVLASAVAAPVNFLGSRQWAFRLRRG